MIPCRLAPLKVVLVLIVVSYARSNRQDRGPATKMWVILWVEQRLVCGAGARHGAHLISAYHTRCGGSW